MSWKEKLRKFRDDAAKAADRIAEGAYQVSKDNPIAQDIRKEINSSKPKPKENDIKAARVEVVHKMKKRVITEEYYV